MNNLVKVKKALKFLSSVNVEFLDIEAIEELIATDPECSYLYAEEVLEGRFQKGEEAISKDAYWSYHYALDVLGGRFEIGEEVISIDAQFSYYYAKDVIEGRFQKGEKVISKNDYYRNLYIRDVYDFTKVDVSPEEAYMMLYNNPEHPQKEELEEIIATDAEWSYHYALVVLKGRFEMGEEIIAKSAQYSYLYARDI